MLRIDSGRITDPKTISPLEIWRACEQREHLVVQFSRPGAYSIAILQRLNEACHLAGGRLQVRFFGHYGARFDAAVLCQLPEVQDLAVDCLSEIDSAEEIGKLLKLRRLSFGVFGIDRPEFLDTINLSQLTHLSLSQNRKRNIDLSPLCRSKSLVELFIEGHSHGIDSISELPNLRKLTLRAFSKSNPLHFVSGMACLAQLKLVLGGRSDIEDLKSNTLKTLQVLRVRGLANLGDFSRLPSLTALFIEDQLKLGEIDLRGANLRRLWFNNCKNLSDLTGLEDQNRLQEFFASRVALDLNVLRDRAWPQSATSVGLHSGSMKWNDDAEARLAARGLGGKSSFWF